VTGESATCIPSDNGQKHSLRKALCAEKAYKDKQTTYKIGAIKSYDFGRCDTAGGPETGDDSLSFTPRFSEASGSPQDECNRLNGFVGKPLKRLSI
jgi:hypothetical protein